MNLRFSAWISKVRHHEITIIVMCPSSCTWRAHYILVAFPSTFVACHTFLHELRWMCHCVPTRPIAVPKRCQTRSWAPIKFVITTQRSSWRSMKAHGIIAVMQRVLMVCHQRFHGLPCQRHAVRWWLVTLPWHYQQNSWPSKNYHGGANVLVFMVVLR